MATFTYLARDAAGKSMTGELIAADRNEATRQLRSMGRYVIRLDVHDAPQAPARRRTRGTGRVRQKEVAYFAHQLALMIDAGLPIAEALDGIIRQTPPGGMHDVLTDLLSTVESGTPLSTALESHRRVFGDMFVNLIRAAEMSGKIGPTMARIADYMTRQRQIAGKIKGALVYPAMLISMCIGMVIFLLTFMLPKFMVIYRGKLELLPTPTRIVAGLSDWMVTYWMIWTAGLALLVVALVAGLRTRRGRIVKDWLMLHAPVIGGVVHSGILARTMHTLGTLVDSGVSMLDAVVILRRINTNHYFQDVWAQVGENLQRGMQLSDPLYASSLFPRSHVQMIEAGEKTGRLGAVLRRLAEFLEHDLNTTIDSTTRLIEPLLIAAMGVIVGGVAASMLLPIFSLSKLVAH